MPTCPNDGTQLDAVRDQPPETAPWLCQTCRSGWWDEELTGHARRLYDPVTRSWPPTVEARSVRDRVDADTRRAKARGNSNSDRHPPKPDDTGQAPARRGR